jgi:hypothetical protein
LPPGGGGGRARRLAWPLLRWPADLGLSGCCWWRWPAAAGAALHVIDRVEADRRHGLAFVLAVASVAGGCGSTCRRAAGGLRPRRGGWVPGLVGAPGWLGCVLAGLPLRSPWTREPTAAGRVRSREGHDRGAALGQRGARRRLALLLLALLVGSAARVVVRFRGGDGGTPPVEVVPRQHPAFAAVLVVTWRRTW